MLGISSVVHIGGGVDEKPFHIGQAAIGGGCPEESPLHYEGFVGVAVEKAISVYYLTHADKAVGLASHHLASSRSVIAEDRVKHLAVVVHSSFVPPKAEENEHSTGGIGYAQLLRNQRGHIYPIVAVGSAFVIAVREADDFALFSKLAEEGNRLLQLLHRTDGFRVDIRLAGLYCVVAEISVEDYNTVLRFFAMLYPFLEKLAVTGGVTKMDISSEDTESWESTNSTIKLYHVLPANYTGASGKTSRFDFASENVLYNGMLGWFTKKELQLMRNEIYARHGYQFSTPEMKEYFSRCPWYSPRGNNNAVVAELSETEQLNIQQIKRAEKEADE